MKINENLHSASVRPADSLFNDTTKTTKQTIRLNVAKAEKALLRRARKPISIGWQSVPATQEEPEPAPISIGGQSVSAPHLSGRFRREPLERMLKVHQWIVDEKYPTALDLAAELEVGHKTICRDIEFMRDHYELPIEFDRARHGYRYTRPVDGFPGMLNLSEQEMSALVVADRAFEQHQGTPFQRPFRKAFQKLSGQLDSKERYALEESRDGFSFRPFAPELTNPEFFKVVDRARRERKVLEFAYRKPGEKQGAVRRVHPYHIPCCDNRWYMIGYDEGRGDVRTFALGRMEEPSVCEERFTRPKNFDPAEYLSGSFAVMKGEGDYEVVIEFDAWGTDLLRGRQWHASQQITELPAGGSRMTMRLSGLEEVERWVLGWGTHCHVAAPVPLVERIGATVRELAGRYAVFTVPVPPDKS